MAGDAILFIIRAKDPEKTALSFSWTGTGGTFTNPIETVNKENNYTEYIVQWTSPNCDVPLEKSGLSLSYSPAY